MSWGRGDNDLIASNVLNPPRGRTQGKYIADARFINHFLIKLTHATRCALTTGDEHTKHAAVRNRASISHRHPLRAGPRGHHTGNPVIDHAWAQLRKIGGRVHARDQVNDRVKDLTRQIPVWPGPDDGVIPVIGG